MYTAWSEVRVLTGTGAKQNPRSNRISRVNTALELRKSVEGEPAAERVVAYERSGLSILNHNNNSQGITMGTALYRGCRVPNGPHTSVRLSLWHPPVRSPEDAKVIVMKKIF